MLFVFAAPIGPLGPGALSDRQIGGSDQAAGRTDGLTGGRTGGRY
jgi:hypothetical protein